MLAEEDVDGSALMTMAADLGQYGHTGLIVTLVGPVYDPTRHGPQAAFHLLRACLETERVAEGKALLGRLRAVSPPPFTRHLDEFERAFHQLHGSEAHA